MVPWEGGGQVPWEQEPVAAGVKSSLLWKGFLVGVHGKASFLFSPKSSMTQEEELCIITTSCALEQVAAV